MIGKSPTYMQDELGQCEMNVDCATCTRVHSLHWHCMLCNLENFIAPNINSKIIISKIPVGGSIRQKFASCIPVQQVEVKDGQISLFSASDHSFIFTGITLYLCISSITQQHFHCLLLLKLPASQAPRVP